MEGNWMNRWNIRLIVSILVLLAFSPGCSSRKVVTRKVIDDPFASLREAKSWVGHTRAELIEVWGNPTRAGNDGEGGEILTYTRDRRLTYTESTAGEFIEPTPLPGHLTRIQPDPYDRGGKSYSVKVRQLGKFWIDPEGIVYRFEMDPKLIDKGEYDPPSKTGVDGESW